MLQKREWVQEEFAIHALGLVWVSTMGVEYSHFRKTTMVEARQAYAYLPRCHTTVFFSLTKRNVISVVELGTHAADPYQN